LYDKLSAAGNCGTAFSNYDVKDVIGNRAIEHIQTSSVLMQPQA